MKISDLTGYSLSSPYGDGNVFGQPQGVKSLGIVEVHTDAGQIGIGETYAGVYAPELVTPIVEFLKPIIVGMDPCDIGTINKSLKIPFISGSGLMRSVISAVDIALWDIKGQIYKKPIYQLLNEQVRDSVKVYASGGSVAMNVDEIHSDVEHILIKGFSAYKMRVGVQPWENDLNRVAAARNKLGKNSELMIDAIMGTLPSPWGVETAISRTRDLVPYRPSWLEEPLLPENYLGYQELSNKTNIPIAMGESFTGLHEFEAYLSGKCVEYIQPDVTHCGGFSQAVKVIALAKTYDVSIALHVWGSAISIMSNLHLALAMPSVEWLEIPQVRLELLEDEIKSKMNIKNGALHAINEPGLGLTLTNKIKNTYPFVSGSGYRVPSQR